MTAVVGNGLDVHTVCDHCHEPIEPLQLAAAEPIDPDTGYAAGYVWVHGNPCEGSDV